ncbi:hypothetical protein [Actinophytocola glycyrrhizae]|uniref:Uncharacterized protein n=1 Tax=Actinophytocola glycyrrhizae TaxID=2044873 RepID=A0ABV9RUD5_9PSEU
MNIAVTAMADSSAAPVTPCAASDPVTSGVIDHGRADYAGSDLNVDSGGGHLIATIEIDGAFVAVVTGESLTKLEWASRPARAYCC